MQKSYTLMANFSLRLMDIQCRCGLVSPQSRSFVYGRDVLGPPPPGLGPLTR